MKNSKKDKLKEYTIKDIRMMLVDAPIKDQITQTANKLNISRNGLYKKIKSSGYEIYKDIRKKKG